MRVMEAGGIIGLVGGSDAIVRTVGALNLVPYSITLNLLRTAAADA